MKDKITKIILEGIGEDAKDPRLDNKQYVPKTEIELIQISKAVARNQTLAELRAKAPDIAERIIEEVMKTVIARNGGLFRYKKQRDNPLDDIISCEKKKIIVELEKGSAGGGKEMFNN
jgi:hypothetical protein